MAWTNYHDWLMTEAIALMSEPGWNEQNEDGTYKFPDLMQRLEQIRGDLSTAAQGMGELPKLDPTTGQILRDESGQIVYESWDDKMGSLLSQFEQSRLQGEDFTNQQINALVGGTDGQWNPYDPATGLGVMSYPQIAQMVQQGYLAPGSNVAQGLYSNSILPDHAQQRWQSVASGLSSQWQTDLARTMGYATDFANTSQGLVQDYGQIGDAAEENYYSGAASTFQNLAEGAMTPEQMLALYQGQDVAGRYDQTLQNVLGHVDQMGEQQRKDITASYDKARASAEQGFSDRGLGNTTVRNSTLTGIAGQEAQELARLNEQMAGMKAGYEAQLGTAGNQANQQWLSQGMGAYQDVYGIQNQLASQYGAYQNTLGNQMAGLWQLPLDQQALANQQLAQFQLGYDSQMSAQANAAALGMAQGGLGAYADFYGMKNALGSQYADYVRGNGQMMAGLWGMAPQAIAGMTSAYPSLADVYNLASQGGTGSTGIFALPGFQPGMMFGTGTGAGGSGSGS
jgi:hypothetical protein